MNHLGLFEGIGGFSLAAKWMGWETIAWCEWDEYCQKVLKYHYPEAEGLGDITKTDFSIYANRIDILTGGFPCQPYSLAGLGKGKADERHLWPHMLRAITEIQPRWVVGENVRGLVNWGGGMVFDEAQTDLESAGYEVFAYILPACAVNAPHKRERIWFVAHAQKIGGRPGQETKKWEELSNGFSNVADTFSERRRSGFDQWEHAIYANACGEEFGFAFNGTGWPTESPLCFPNDGISARLSGITFPAMRRKANNALGNAIVPQVALQIYKAINNYESLK